MKKTKIINLLGSSGSGKSTMAAELYSYMKKLGMDVELVREYVKSWAWENRKINKYDQIYFFGKQTRYESFLYGKVEYIITDSPIFLVSFYEEFYFKKRIVFPAVMNFINDAKENGYSFYNFWIDRQWGFQDEGRFEDENQSNIVNDSLKLWLKENNIEIIDSIKNTDDRCLSVLKELGVQNE